MDREGATPSVWMWVGRLTPPMMHQRDVSRHALLARLQEQSQVALTLVVSPPGFGKTTLLSQWRATLQANGDAVAWLSLEESDADPHRFLAYVLLALEGAGLALGGLSQHAHAQSMDSNAEATVASLLQALARGGKRIRLILDDYHRASSHAVDTICLRLLEQGGPWLQLVVASRVRPPWPLAALAVRGLLQELDGNDLILSLPEASRILAGTSLDAQALQDIHARTEGWAVAVQLARLWLSRGGDGNDVLPHFSGQVSDVAQYLAEQIFTGMPPVSREFLVETSLLERFNGELADAVREQTDSVALLECLQPYEALVVPLDAGRNWFRYHGMLADFLRSRLSPQRAQQIHRAAAVWLAGQGDWAMAVRHALQAQDVALAVSVIHRAGGWKLVLHKGIRYSQSMLQPFDALARRTEPELLLMQAYLYAKLGDHPLSMELLRLATIAVESAPELRDDLQVIEALVRVYFDQFEDDAHGLVDGETVARARPEDPLSQGTLLCVDAVAALAKGRFDDAIEAAQAARTRMRLVGSPLGENYCLMHAAQALSAKGEVVQARRTIEEALVLAETNFGTDSSLKALVGCFKAQHLYWNGQWDEALTWFRAGQDTLSQVDGWLDLFAATIEVSWRIAMRQNGLQDAMRLLDVAAQQARGRCLHRLSRLVQAWRVDLLAQCGFVAQAQQEAGELESRLLSAQANASARQGSDWRFLEAGELALARLQLAAGGAAVTRGRLERCAHQFEQRGQLLPAWRLRLLALLALRRDQVPDIDKAIEQALSPVLRHGLAGLLLELGPGILGALQPLEGALPPSINATMTRLRGWRAHPPRPTASFSQKETAVLQLLVAGHSNKAIARAMDVSENTVKFHLKQIFQRLGVDSRAAATAAALQQGLVVASSPHAG